jgi:hypothetical protein
MQIENQMKAHLSYWNCWKNDKHVRIIIANANWEPNESTFALLQMSKKLISMLE